MKKFGKLIVLAIAVMSMTALLATVSFTQELTDIKGHWAEEYIKYGVEAGYINGYEDGTFLPDKSVTRVEFSKMINSAVKLTATGVNTGNFIDLDVDEWYFVEVKKAENAGYINGYEDGTFRPANPITRQEAAVVLSRIVLPVSERIGMSKFGDGETVDVWARDAVAMIAAKGYIKGDEFGNFVPKGALTRSQAAKLICEFVKNENIINTNQVVYNEDDEVVFSETLFTDDVVIRVPEDTNIIFKGCRVLGTITVSTENIEVDFEGTAVKNLIVEADDVVLSTDANSAVKTTSVYNLATLKGNGFEYTAISGSDLSYGVVYLNGTFDTVDVSENAVISAGTVARMNVCDKVNLVLLKGDIEVINVDSAASGTTINLSEKATIEEASNNAPVTYMGSGKIKRANNNVYGVVFNGVSVDMTTGKDTGSANENVSGGSFFSNAIVTPANGSTNIGVTATISIHFNDDITDKNGNALTRDYIEDYVDVRIGSSAGSGIPFVASVTSKKIVINPLISYNNGTYYYIVIPAGVLKDKDGRTNEEFSSYFFTEVDYNNDYNNGYDNGYNNNTNQNSVTITFEHANGYNIPIDTDIKVTFSEKVYSSYNQQELTAKYCEDTAFQIRKNSVNGEIVDFTASINRRTVTLVPTESLDPGSTYHVIVNNGALYTSSGSYIYSESASFTTASGLPMTIVPANGSTSVSRNPEIYIEFSEPVLTSTGGEVDDMYLMEKVVSFSNNYYNYGYGYGYGYGSNTNFYAEISPNAKKITIIPNSELTAGGIYYISVNAGTLMGENSGALNDAGYSTFTVASSMTPDVKPGRGDGNVSVGTPITVSFSEELYTYDAIATNRVLATVNYITTNKVVVLKEQNSGGNEVPCTVTLEDAGKTIKLVPVSPLNMNSRYYIVVKASMLCNQLGTTNTAYSSFFNTNEALVPSFSLNNGTELYDTDVNVPVDSNITIKFSETVYNNNGKEVEKNYVANNVIMLYKNAKSAANRESFAVVGTTIRDTITIDPYKLEGSTTYYLEVVGNTLKNEAGVPNPAYTISFTTAAVVTDKVTITPASGTVGVTTLVTPIVEFESPVQLKGGGTYLSPNVLKEAFVLSTSYYYYDYNYNYNYNYNYGYGYNTTNPNVEATVSTADNKKFVITPKAPLAEGTTYYVHVVGDKLEYGNGTPITARSQSFTTISKMPALTNVKVNADETSAVVEYTSNAQGDLKVEVNGTLHTTVSNVNVGNGTVKLEGLTGATTYNIEVYIVSGGIESVRTPITFTTKTPAPVTPPAGSNPGGEGSN